MHTSLDSEGSSKKAGRLLRPFPCSSATRAGKLSTRLDTQGEKERITGVLPIAMGETNAGVVWPLGASSLCLSRERAPATSFWQSHTPQGWLLSASFAKVFRFFFALLFSLHRTVRAACNAINETDLYILLYVTLRLVIAGRGCPLLSKGTEH